MQETLQESYDGEARFRIVPGTKGSIVNIEEIQNVGSIIRYQGAKPVYKASWLTPYHVGGCI